MFKNRPVMVIASADKPRLSLEGLGFSDNKVASIIKTMLSKAK